MTLSLRRRLVLTLVGLLIPVMLAVAVGADLGLSAFLRGQHDLGLAGRARDLATLLEREPERYEFEFNDAQVPEYGPGGTAYFEIWRVDGSPLIRSASLAATAQPTAQFAPAHVSDEAEHVAVPRSAMPRLSAGSLQAPAFADIELPDGRPARAAGFRFVPRLDSDILASEAAQYSSPVDVTVIHDVVELNASLWRARVVLCGLGVFAVGIAVFGARWAVRRGLAPLAAINAQIDEIDERRLSERLDVQQVPDELRPPLHRINALLERMQRSLQHERRFSADIGHELRTPLAAVLAVAEVALSRERDAATYREALVECKELAAQMREMSETLLCLASSEALPVSPRSVALQELAADLWAPLAAAAAVRNLGYSCELGATDMVVADRDLLAQVLRNLLANATQYTEDGGQVIVRRPPAGGIVEVWDSGPQVSEGQLDDMFERFWRADSARSSAGLHAGLGLSLARELSRAMGLDVVARNTPDGGLGFSVVAGSTDEA